MTGKKRKPHTEETKAKIRAGNKGKKHTSKKIGIATKGKLWYNNGIETVMRYEGEQPEGFVRGRVGWSRRKHK